MTSDSCGVNNPSKGAEPLLPTADGLKRALLLNFTLPPSTYATMLVREVIKISTDSFSMTAMNPHGAKELSRRTDGAFAGVTAGASTERKCVSESESAGEPAVGAGGGAAGSGGERGTASAAGAKGEDVAMVVPTAM